VRGSPIVAVPPKALIAEDKVILFSRSIAQPCRIQRSFAAVLGQRQVSFGEFRVAVMVAPGNRGHDIVIPESGPNPGQQPRAIGERI
jgi:hypothetical protein